MQLVDKLEELAFRMGAVAMCVSVGTAAEERYEGNHHITQLLVRKSMKLVEFTEELVSAIRAGRGGPALALTRTLLEDSVELSWAADSNLKQSSEDRLLRILRRAYEEAENRGSLPAAERAQLEEARKRHLKLSPEAARNAMQEMDAAEVRAGGQPYWESHYRQFELSSDYVHATFLGPGRFAVVGDEMHVDMNPDAVEGVAALRWGLFYFVRGADAVLRLVGLDDDAKTLAGEYASIKALADEELAGVLASHDS